MGLPQVRRRCFIIGRRKDCNLPAIRLNFNNATIPAGDIFCGDGKKIKKDSKAYLLWQNRLSTDGNLGGISKRIFGKVSMFSTALIKMDKPSKTITTSEHIWYHTPQFLSPRECALLSSFPEDYDYMGMQVQYLCGMCVPPIMTANIAAQIAKQLFNK